LLDTDTKRRIDTARDILVGKVPDPKSQVEQITIALIYKFMDDMDAESEELGGKRKFFTGDYARFGWAKLMRSGLGGHETLNLYAEGITTMPENPGIPLLFREIFKNAYLPYRDPETLKSFLKVIDEFSYDHSERLGDAFEYLLSVLGSQGDAGQFRTPRHIIDFIVSVVDPKKNETILDPACGTAGFLISSYKHILRANTNSKGKVSLAPDEKGRLAQNIKGYDISPDMVRLSLVNLYLHGFPDPHIYEYDTLTQDERWSELFDVILANPPFMSPKGGIKPHKRFSIDAKRSEVLFVDYMAEHLGPNGRAGIIVPEGIIFQSQTAYKELRKMLVKNSLVAVISLPAGCFNPYSGVKTSILVLDKSLARQSDSVAFFKVENDGFGLGAQRRAIEKNDLPQVKAEIEAYLHAVRSQQSANGLQLTCGVIASKEKIAANGDYSLNGERYREGVVASGVWPDVALGDVTRRVSGGTPSKANSKFWSGSIPWVSPKDMKQDVLFDTEDHVSQIAVENSATSLVPAGTLLCVVRSGILKHSLPLAITAREMCFNQDIIALIPSDGRLEVRFLFWMLQSKSAEILETGIKPGVTVQSFHSGFFSQFRIPLPPIELQRDFLAEIESYQKVIDGALGVLDNYRPHIPIHPDWPIVLLGELIQGKPKNGYSGNPVDFSTGLRVLSLSATTSGKLDISKFKFIDEDIPVDSACRCQRGDIYLQRGNTKELVGTAAMFDVDASDYIYPDLMIRVRADEKKIRSYFLLTVLQSAPVRGFLTANAVGAAGSMPKINQGIVERIPIPVPPLSIQEEIVAEIEAEKQLLAANRELIVRFEKKIEATLARIWGEEEA
jgi:type I restriction enzyme M protein